MVARMAMREADVGVELRLIEGSDGTWSLPSSSPGEPLRWRCLYERERVRAEAAEARAQAAEAQARRWRHAEIDARSKAGSYKFQFEAVREKLTEARAETGSIRDTAKQALSLQAEVARLSKLVDAAGLQSGRRPGMVSLRKQVGRLQQENAELRRDKAALRRRNSSLERKNSTLVRRNTGLRKRARKAEAAQAKTVARIESLEVRMTALGASRAVISRRLYGRSSEKQDRPGSKRPRGQQRGAPGHGRTARPGLGQRLEVRQPPAGECVCSRCGMPYVSNGEHCTEIVEIDVRAYKRRVVRPRRRRGCGCGDAPREVAAAPVRRLFARTPYGITVWASAVMERYVCHRPLNGVAAWLGYQGLTISPGTLAGGLGRMEAWFEPLAQAILDHQNSAPVRHGDETGWRVQELRRDGRSARAWLWVSVTPDAVYYHVDATRSAAAALVVFGEVKVEQVLVVDRYASYKKLARLLDGRVILAWCWAHQRRDFIECAAGQGTLAGWCKAWLERIVAIYRLNKARLAHYEPGAQQQGEAYCCAQRRLQTELDGLFAAAEAELAQLQDTAREAGPLRSLLNHREGLSVFLQRPEVPMDNNFAERTLRGAAIGRQLSFGSDSKKGARLTAIMYSVVQTLALNGIDVRGWLHEYLGACAANGGRAPPDLSPWLPWSMSPRRRRTLTGKA